jgi:phosphate transport system substrate-binding protein
VRAIRDFFNFLEQNTLAQVTVCVLLASILLYSWSIFGKVFQPVPTSTSSPTSSVISTPTSLSTYYKDFEDVPFPEMTVYYGGSTSFAPIRCNENDLTETGCPGYNEDDSENTNVEQKIELARKGLELVYRAPLSGENPGSGKGIEMLIKGDLNVAQSSRDLNPEDRKKAREQNALLKSVQVGFDGIAVYVNPQVHKEVAGLTITQIKDIYSGNVTSWNRVGGPNLQQFAIKPATRIVNF